MTIEGTPQEPPEEPDGVKDRLTPSVPAEERIEAAHRHVVEDADQLHDEMVEARERLHTGTSADAIELANSDIPKRAAEAAARFRPPAQPQ